MTEIDYIMYAGIVFCAAMGGYLFFLAQKQARIAKRIEHIQIMMEEQK